MILKNSEPVYNQNILKTKIKSYSYEDTDFHDKEIPKLGLGIKLALINIHFALKMIKTVTSKCS